MSLALSRRFLAPILKPSCRQFQTFGPLWNAAKAESKTSNLGTLRRKTGYSLSLCKQALAENGQNLEKAEKWLNDQAQAQGWSKAQKLEGRNTTQGLIGMYVEGNLGAMVELNCETDFVAKNSKFHSLLNDIVSAKFQHLQANQPTGDVAIQFWAKEQLGELKVESGKTLGDLVALNIGQIGENIVLRRGVTFVCNKSGFSVIGLTHPSGSPMAPNRIAYGRYGTFMAYTKDPNSGTLPEGQTVSSIARQLCQHIIGMNPKSVGNFEDKSTWPLEAKSSVDSESAPVSRTPRAEGETEDDDVARIERETQVNVTEDAMIHQPFLMDSEILVRDLLTETGIRIDQFVRFEVGQSN